MKFKYSVIGDNTQENREWLEKLGYKLCPCVGRSGQLFTTENGGVHFADSDVILENEIGKTNSINCIGNPSLFKAVSAMREDSDIWQWFTDGDSWNLCADDNYLRWCMENAPFQHPDIHKATLTELQEKFKL